jgi:DNA-binding beta-propeller fold protein YncE
LDSPRYALIRIIYVFSIFLILAGTATFALNSDPVLWISRVSGRQLTFPSDVAVDRRGVAFLLNSGNRTITIFSPKGMFLREISGRGVWKDPMAIAISPDGSIYLADGNAGRILQIELSGEVRREMPVGRNARVTGVGFYGDSVYCVDNRNAKISVFDRKGKRTAVWGRKGEQSGEFHAPFRLAIDGAGRLFITDVMNARVQWFSPFGQYLGTLKQFGAAEGKIFRPTGIDIDSKGRIWIGDSYTGLVQLFEENGTLVRSLNLGGRPHVFGDPVGVADGPQAVWVADQRENKVGWFPK